MDVEPKWTGILLNRKLGPLPPYLHRIKPKLVDIFVASKEIETSPLNVRAWVVQERVLSRRHLFMTCNQLWWECHGLWANEVFPGGVEKNQPYWSSISRIGYYALTTLGYQSIHHGALLASSPVDQNDNTIDQLPRHSSSKELSKVDMEDLWKNLTLQYTSCNLTYASDKLPALSGVAQIFSIAQGSGFSLDENSYLAGIWRPHLPNALCWRVAFSNKYFRRRPDAYRAPSWSWASIDGTIEHYYKGKSVSSVMDVKIVYDDERYKAGAVKGGVLHLNSHLIGPLTYEGSSGELIPDPSLDDRIKEALYGIQPRMCRWDEYDGLSTNRCISYLDHLSGTVHKDGIVDGTGAVRKRVMCKDVSEEPRIRLFLVPICYDVWGTDVELTYLILCQVVNNPGPEGFDYDAAFQRVGLARYLMVKDEVLDLFPKRTIAIV